MLQVEERHATGLQARRSQPARRFDSRLSPAALQTAARVVSDRPVTPQSGAHVGPNLLRSRSVPVSESFSESRARASRSFTNASCQSVATAMLRTANGSCRNRAILITVAADGGMAGCARQQGSLRSVP